MDEHIELTIDGVPCALDAVPPELKAHVEKSLAAARAAAEKAGAGRAKLRINIKRGQAAMAASQTGPISPGSSPGDRARIAVILLAVAGGLVFLAMKSGLWH